MRPYLRKHKEKGYYENCMCELTLEGARAYRSWIRMNTDTFEELLAKVRPLIVEQDTPFRQAILPGERLPITFCYLATGAMYRNFMGTLSILLMAVLDADPKFLYAGVGRNFRMNNSNAWAAASQRAHIGRGSAGFPEPAQLRESSKFARFVIFGNEGVRLKPCLVRSFPAD
ncbi:hypothetical protein HPB47_014801 [Ixodes persulcatus]|uniref:Uncharacterized protein n=1 Tax=Ixodes persulcatus TaxID=34615 RepID=A0AC60QXN3_IXOPE|nr:hypothetical protein HPB47_014801 [Ixodes persulcatus]